MDESKKQGNVQISEDKTEMSVSPYGDLGPNARTSSSKLSASQSFSKGLHYWEVEVGGCESWAVGIMEINRGRGIQTSSVSQENNSWILECEGGDLSALHNNEFSRVKESSVQTLGVFLDCDKGKVKFYNVNTGCILHSFAARFKHSVCPVFSISSQKENTSRLKLCNLIYKEEQQYDSANVSVTSESLLDEDMASSSESSI